MTFRAKDHISQFNIAKRKLENSGNLFGIKDLQNYLIECNIPHSPVFISKMVDFGIIKRLKGQTFSFMEVGIPVHFSKLQDVHTEFHYTTMLYNNRSKCSELVNNHKEEIEKAIELLKKEGYIIYKQM